MTGRRFHRLATTFFMVVSLLFSQLALARYVCPRQMDMQAVAGQPCAGMDMEQPALCHQHAADAGASFEAVKLPSAAQPLLIQVLELPAFLEAAALLPPGTAVETRPPPDPLFLSTLRLRV
ncbi:MAG TPA: hypothetical protein VIN03_26375 [Roseateles sp.]